MSRTPKFHELKTWTEYFDEIVYGDKKFEFRQDDGRDFQVGDYLHLCKYDPDTQSYVDDDIWVLVTSILHGGQFGLPEGYVIMSIVEDYPPTGDDRDVDE